MAGWLGIVTVCFFIIKRNYKNQIGKCFLFSSFLSGIIFPVTIVFLNKVQALNNNCVVTFQSDNFFCDGNFHRISVVVTNV